MLDDQSGVLDEASAMQMPQASLVLNMDGLSFEEYFKKVEEMVELMRQHWKSEQRVKTLKVVIQLTKLLADTSQMKLYPRKFKLITDCLDEFGQLIYTRVHTIATTPLEDNHTQGRDSSCNSHASNISPYEIGSDRSDSKYFKQSAAGYFQLESRELAKDICRNWFLKAASIRELVPRFFIELAILKSCDILFNSASKLIADSIEEQFFAQTLRRLGKTAWGFGNPIVALHARAYLCKVAERLIGWVGPTHEAILFELLSSNLRSSARLIGYLDTRPIVDACKHVQVPAAQLHGASEMSMYFDLISSPIQSILKVVTLRYDLYTDEEDFIKNATMRLRRISEELMDDQTFEVRCNFSRNIVLHSLFKAVPNDIIASLAERFRDKLAICYREWVTDSDNVDGSEHGKTLVVPSIYATLTSFIIALEGSESFEMESQKTKSSMLETCDKLLTGLMNYEQNRLSVAYLRCFKALLSYVNHYLDDHVDGLLTRFVETIKRGRQYVKYYATLLDIIKTLFTNRTRIEEFKRIFNSRPFCQLLELLRKDEHKMDASKWILETMRANIKLNYKGELVTITDRLTINSLLKLFGNINDALNPLTFHDDIKHLSDLIIFFLDIVSIDDIPERLEFYSQCRKNVSNLDIVLEHLIRAVLEQSHEYRKVERRRRARQNFSNGCLAFCFATTPALNDPLIRLELYQSGCDLALNHMSLSLADYFMKQIMHNLSELLTPSSMGQDDRANSSTPANQEDASTNSSIEGQQQRWRQASQQSNTTLMKRTKLVLQMVVRHQDRVDLKHKLNLVRMLKECPSVAIGGNSRFFHETFEQLNSAIGEQNEGFIYPVNTVTETG